jgi:nucleotide-binding universal stress UspA family protein
MKKRLKILVPFDFSRHSRETLDFALSLQDFADPDYVLVHVVASGEVETFATLGGEPADAHARRIEEAFASLEEEAGRCRAQNAGLKIECRVASGVPFHEICRLADEENIQLIVIGTHGRTGLSHLLIGSTAERVVQHASCPVLSIKPRVL